jgi:subtilisin family serine protease
LVSLAAGQPVDLIIEYEVASIERDTDAMRQQNKLDIDDDTILAYKAERYKKLKDEIDLIVANPDIESLVDYPYLPMTFKRIHSQASLNTLLARPEIKAVYLNKPLHTALAQSLPLINQPAIASIGQRGLGTTVVVIDNGIDYTNAAFGSCSSPSVPVGCHVSVSLNFGTGTTDNLHGTNVSAIVLGIAPDSRIAMLNVFSGTSAFTANILSAINWTILNKSTYNIVAINLSLGDGIRNIAPCSIGNAFATPVANAIKAGIAVVAAAGNNAYTDGLNQPACTPGVISVGAVYDSDLSTQGLPSGISWGLLCTDTTTAADKITCFSNSASFLTMLAPGANITAAGITEAGTSQASPHVAGAVAILRAEFPLETLNQTQARLINSGTKITDPRNGVMLPRLNLGLGNAILGFQLQGTVNPALHNEVSHDVGTKP